MMKSLPRLPVLGAQSGRTKGIAGSVGGLTRTAWTMCPPAGTAGRLQWPWFRHALARRSVRQPHATHSQRAVSLCAIGMATGKTSHPAAAHTLLS